MIRLQLSEIASIVGGELRGPDGEVFGSVETDSRLVSAGSLFFAKPGEVTDGHKFIDSAKELGAVGAVVERVQEDISIPQILVADTVAALGALAAGVLEKLRERSAITVIGITGSNGKTSTKNMLGAILREFGETVSPIESYNNEVGAPISMLKVDDSTKYLVVEMGAGGLGSIAYLAEMAKPDIGVVLKVGLAHAGEFGGIEVTAKIKGELPEALTKDGTFIYNADDGLVSAMTELTDARMVSFGTSKQATNYFDNVELSMAGTSADFHFANGDVRRLELQILGEHQLMNAAAAVTVAEVLGLPMEKVFRVLRGMPLAERWRMQLSERADGI